MIGVVVFAFAAVLLFALALCRVAARADRREGRE
jgi:hypothetical protein